MEIQLPDEHENRFTTEGAFLEHYERARKIARHPDNYIRVHAGEDLLGIPARDPETGQVLMDAGGRAVWQSTPRSGLVLSSDGQRWEPVPFLAPHMQTTLVQAARSGGAAMRVTPEIRCYLVGGMERRLRTLSVEINLANAIELDKNETDALGETMKPLIRLFFPLHAEVETEIIQGEPVVYAPGVYVTPLLFRHHANHDLLADVIS